MKITKGQTPSNKAGGMKAHIPSSPGNNPTASRGTGEFGGKAAKHLNTDKSIDSRKSRPCNEPKGV